MGRIIPKLNLNKTPQIVDDNSLVMAKNIRLLKDGTIGPDTSLEEIEVGAVIDHTESVTVVDVEPDITETHDYLLSIHHPGYYDRRNSIDKYITIDDIYYNQLSYDPTDTTFVIEDDVYILSRNEFLHEHSEFLVNTTSVYSKEFDNCVLLYLIHLGVFNGGITFDILEFNGIKPYYYCIAQLSDVDKIITIQEEKYIIVNPWTIYDNITISSSGGITHTEIRTIYDPVRYIGQIVGLDNKIYFVKEATQEEFATAGLTYPSVENERIRIFEYDEITKTFTIVKCGWRYSGGVIDGQVTTNNTSEYILTICEYFNTDTTNLVPIKHINLSKCQESDDETIYTQTPNIPFTNLYFTDYYQCTIPNGVYQFFVRYKIRDDFYTEWFPCSEELFAGAPVTTETIQGTLRYVDKHRDCPRSFKFRVEHLFDGQNGTTNYIKNFSEFQIGFILSHDDSVVARTWKSFPFDNENRVNEIYFDYDKNIIKEIDIDELLKTNFEIFNVENLTYYKNKLFIANFEETNFNPLFQSYADAINMTLINKTISFDTGDPSILGKNLTKSSSNLIYYDKWGGRDAKYLLLINDIVDSSVLSDTSSNKDYYNTTTTKFVAKAEMYWKNSKNINASKNYYERDVYWLRQLELGLTLYDDNNRYGVINTYNYSEFDNPGDANLLGNYSGIVNWQDANNHQAAKDSLLFKHKWYWRGGSINAHQEPGNGWPYFAVYKYGLRQQHAAEAQWKNSLLTLVKDKYPSLIVANISINYTGGSKRIIGSNTYFSNNNTQINGHPVAYNKTYTDDELKNYVFDLVKDHIVGVKNASGTDNGKFVILDNNDTLRDVDSISAVFITLDYSVNCESITNNTEITNDLYVNAVCKQRTIEYDCSLKNIEYNRIDNKYEYKTLMPFTDYEFYIHYVKQNGVATNGYYISTEHTNIYTNVETDLEIIYPVFSDITIPEGYVGYFISINKVKNDVARLFNIRRNDANKDTNYIYADCLECDTMLYPLSKNIKIYKKAAINNQYVLTPVSANGEYFSSGSNNPIKEFGNCGEIRWPADEDPTLTDVVYSPISSTIYIPKNTGLIGIIIRAGFDDGFYTHLTDILDTRDCLTNNVINITDLGNALNNIISGYKCLGIRITPKYESIWAEVVYETVPTEPVPKGKNDKIKTPPNTELKGWYITLYSKNYVSNNVTTNDVIYLGLNIVYDPYISTISDVITRLDEYYVTDDDSHTNVLKSAIALNNFLTDIISGDQEDEAITIVIAEMLMTNIQYSTLLENTYWVIIDNNNENNKNKRLTKITPFIATGGSYDNYELNLPGFINVVNKLQHNPADTLYVSGTDIYSKLVSNNNITLHEIEGTVGNYISERIYIPSNFNLNCVTLNDDITPTIRTYLPNLEDEDTTAKQIIKAVNTLTCSSILTLPTMYYDYIKKYYSVYNTEQKYKFDNTVRSSDSNIDETYRNIYKFKAEDYYNVPVNRGIITNIFNLTNYIYIHTEHSLFRFGGMNSLSSTEGDVQLKESDVFDSGIIELFDAQHGYAGLKYKNQSVVMFDSYVFWDDYVQQIYAFGGEGKIISISDPIDKIIKEFKPTDIQFVSDEPNDRFFINFRKENSNICFSYNFKVNAVISVHDLDFSIGFNTRLHTYFVHTDVYDEREIGWSIYHIIDNLVKNDNKYFIAYQNCWKPSVIQISDIRHQMNEKPLYGVAEALVDIIHNTNYELVKELDYINWICSEISQYGFTDNCVAEESLNRKYAGTKLRVYSDECSTNLIPLTNSTNGNALISNEASSLSNPNSYQYPRYNCGVWSLNYFRDTRNKTDIFGYEAVRNQITGGNGHSETTNLTEYSQRQFYTQENSLIYGKYLVFRLIFDNRNFKLENVTFRASNYDKVK